MAVLQGGVNPVTDSSGVAVTSLTTSVTVAAGSNRAMAVCVNTESDGADGVRVSSITFDATALTLHDRISSATWSAAEVWRLIAPAVVTGNVVVTLNIADVLVVGIYKADDVDQTTPLATAAKSAATTGTSVSNTVAGVVSGDLAFDALGIDGTEHVAAVGADQTERYDIESGATQTTGASSTQAGSAGGVMSWTWTTSKPNSHVATAFKDAAGAAAVIGKTYVQDERTPMRGVQRGILMGRSH